MTTTFIVVPAVVVAGWVVKANLVAAPKARTLKGVEVVPVKPAATAVMVHPVAGIVPTVTPVNVATPLTAFRVSVPPSVVPTPVMVIGLVAVGTVLLLASCTVTVTTGLKAAPATVVVG